MRFVSKSGRLPGASVALPSEGRPFVVRKAHHGRPGSTPVTIKRPKALGIPNVPP